MYIQTSSNSAIHVEFEKASGYILPLGSTIQELRKDLRGDRHRDSCVAIHYPENGNRSVLFSRGISVEEAENQRNVDICFMADQIVNSTRLLDYEKPDSNLKFGDHTDDYIKIVSKDNRKAALFVRCKDGVIGISWYCHNDNSQKALRMCASLAYALGCINEKTDSVLYKICHDILPDDAGLIKSANDLDDIIDSTINDAKDFSIEVITVGGSNQNNQG